MYDILFDTVKRDIVMTGSGDTGDFATTTNPSVQNGGILLYSRCAVLTNPMYGIGVEQLMNAHPAVAVSEMNRWQAMCKQDGATLAKWSGSANAEDLFVETTQVSYL